MTGTRVALSNQNALLLHVCKVAFYSPLNYRQNYRHLLGRNKRILFDQFTNFLLSFSELHYRHTTDITTDITGDITSDRLVTELGTTYDIYHVLGALLLVIVLFNDFPMASPVRTYTANELLFLHFSQNLLYGSMSKSCGSL